MFFIIIQRNEGVILYDLFIAPAPNIMQVIMLEIFECSEVKKQQNGHYFAVGHFAGTITALFSVFGQHLEFLIS